MIDNGRAFNTYTMDVATNSDVFAQGAHYGVPGVKCDGQNMVDVMRTGRAVTDYVRGSGPAIMQVRPRNHTSVTDTTPFRTSQPIAARPCPCPFDAPRSRDAQNGRIGGGPRRDGKKGAPVADMCRPARTRSTIVTLAATWLALGTP